MNTTGVTTNGLTTQEFTLSAEIEPETHQMRLMIDPRTLAFSSATIQHERVAKDPEILNGDPYIRGTRIPVAVILDGLAEGLTPEELIENFPRLTDEDIRAALEYSASLVLRAGE